MRPFEEICQMLSEPLEEKHVKQREGSFGKMLDYVEGWYCYDEANRIFGHLAWDRDTVDMQQETAKEEPTDKADNNGKQIIYYVVGYAARVRITVRCWGENGQLLQLHREGTGMGTGKARHPNDAIELAKKEAETDASKRAFATFGPRFGLYLYDKDRKKTPAPSPQPKRLSKANSRPIFTGLEREVHELSTIEELRKWWTNDRVTLLRNSIDASWVTDLRRLVKEQSTALEGQLNGSA